MNFFRKLERKFGRFAIPNLMYYIIMMYAAGFVMSLFNPYFYVQYLALDAAAILRGQVWRIVTFLVCPPQSGVLFALLAMYLYYSIGSTLERVWGTFRFNMFFFMGVLGHIIAAFLVYGVTGFSVPMSPYYLNESLFLAFACTFPEMQFLLIFIPIRAKYLGMMYGALLVYSFLTGGIIAKIEIVVSMLNFIIFFLMTRNYRKISPKEAVRKQKFKNEMQKAQITRLVDRCRRNRVTLCLIHRNTLAGQCCLVDRACSFQDHTVHRDIFTWAYNKYITLLYLVNRNLCFHSIPDDNSCLRCQFHQSL